MAGGTNLYTPINGSLAVCLSTAEGQVGTDQLAMLASCKGVPPTTAGLFAHGCLITQTDSASGAEAVWQNTGTSAVPVWGLLQTSGASGTTYGMVAKKTNGTTDVNLFDAATAPFAARLTSFSVIPNDQLPPGTSITLGGGLSTSGTIATIVTGSNGYLTGTTLANIAIAAGDVLTIRSSSTTLNATALVSFLA